MQLANSVNADQAGFQSIDLTLGEWFGRTLQAGTGIIITDGDGVAADPIISADDSVLIEFVDLDTGITPIHPIAGHIILSGDIVAAGTNPIRTDGTATNKAVIEVQISQALAAADSSKIGLSNFNSDEFTVDVDGFVSIVGGPAITKVEVDAFTGPGTNPVLPDGTGQITVTGGQVAAGTTTNVIRTDSLAANTYTIEIQRSTATIGSTIGANGVCHFDSSQFAVDADGFVTITIAGAITKIAVDAHTAPGTDPVLPDGSGQITVTGGQVPAGTTANVIQTDSLAANTYTIEIQRSQAVASAQVGDNGVSHFDSQYFTVDSDGFVSINGGSLVEGILVDVFTAPGTDPVVPDALGDIRVTGAQIAAGSTPNVIRTDSLLPNTYTIEIQRSQAAVSSTLADNGVSHFNSAQFTVDANGFVSIIGGAAITKVQVDTFTGPGTNPVLPDATGKITVTGAQVAAGTIANVIRTDSLAANTYTIQIQRSQAVGVTTLADNGVCHFNSADFTVDANGFVSLVGGAALTKVNVDANTAPGTNPVLSDGSGAITVTGGQVAAGTTANVIQTDSLAANTYTIEIQRSQAVASSTVGDNGVSHFNSSVFSVDSNAFVDLATTFFQAGTWTPVLAFGGASTGITYALQDGRFQLVGNVVYVQFLITLTNKGSAVGNATVSGLPFTVINDANYSGNGMLGASLITLDAGFTYNFAQYLPNATSVRLVESGSTQNVTDLADTNFANGTSFSVWGFYFKQ